MLQLFHKRSRMNGRSTMIIRSTSHDQWWCLVGVPWQLLDNSGWFQLQPSLCRTHGVLLQVWLPCWLAVDLTCMCNVYNCSQNEHGAQEGGCSSEHETRPQRILNV